jgi:hypothetical protein
MRKACYMKETSFLKSFCLIWSPNVPTVQLIKVYFIFIHILNKITMDSYCNQWTPTVINDSNCNHYTEKKKIKFSSYIRKFRMEQLQSHIWLTASSYMGKYLRISSYTRKPLQNEFATAPLWISLYMRKI